MKIEATNAYSFIRHTKLLGYLAGKLEVKEAQQQAASYEGEQVYKKLIRIEKEMHLLAEKECNGSVDEKYSERLSENAKRKINELLPRLKNFGGFFLNGDPRGYSLKIKEDVKEKIFAETGFSMYSDFGGYGILAPEF